MMVARRSADRPRPVAAKPLALSLQFPLEHPSGLLLLTGSNSNRQGGGRAFAADSAELSRLVREQAGSEVVQGDIGCGRTGVGVVDSRVTGARWPAFAGAVTNWHRRSWHGLAGPRASLVRSEALAAASHSKPSSFIPRHEDPVAWYAMPVVEAVHRRIRLSFLSGGRSHLRPRTLPLPSAASMDRVPVPREEDQGSSNGSPGLCLRAFSRSVAVQPRLRCRLVQTNPSWPRLIASSDPSCEA